MSDQSTFEPMDQQATKAERSATPKQPMPLGPDSYTWQDFGSYLYHLMLPQAFILQSAHPVIDAAVGKDKKYKNDPWGRAKNSTALLWPVVYARPEKAIEKGQTLRELHRHIKGVDKNGKRYHALDPEAYSWVHLTGFDATIRMYQYFGKSITAAQRALMFEEWKQIGAMLGIHERYIPQTEAEYWVVFNNMIEQRLIYGEVLEDLLSPYYFRNYPKPPNMPWLPGFVWKMAITPAGWFFHKLSVITLPENFRTKLNLKVSKSDKFLFKTFATIIKAVFPLLPRQLQYIPLASRAIKDAKSHPEAYRWNNRTADLGNIQA